MFQNNTSIICQKVLFLLVIVVTIINCKTSDEFEKDCIIIKGKDCDRLKADGIDESYTFLDDTTWLKYDSYEEKLEACQIPDSALVEMCTYNLVKTCLDHYPFLLDIVTFNNTQDGFKRYKDTFNGIQELIKRCDGCLQIIDYYRELSSMIHPDSTLTFQGSWGVIFAEIFLAQPDFFSQLSEKDRLYLFNLAFHVRTLKLNDSRQAGLPVLSSNWILSRLMVFENYNPFIIEISKSQNLNHFIETMYPLDKNGYMEIDSLIHKYSNEFLKP